jgi:hypothetical protein
MRTAAVLDRTGLTVRRLDYLTRAIWPEKLTGTGIPRNYDDREIAVLEFAGVLARSPLFPEGLPVEVARLLDQQVETGEERLAVLDGKGWSVVLAR